MRSRPVALVLVAGLVLAACGSSPSANRALSNKTPLPAGPFPSEIAKMVCAPLAQHDMAEVLGEKAVVSTPVWHDHQYSCIYRYPTGSFTLAVKELSSWSQTKDYFATFGKAQGVARSIGNLGQGAYQTASGSVIVRKDWKVLNVDVSSLPAQFAKPPASRTDVAVTVADVILTCWAGD